MNFYMQNICLNLYQLSSSLAIYGGRNSNVAAVSEASAQYYENKFFNQISLILYLVNRNFAMARR
jgi:hypothetical protein